MVLIVQRNNCNLDFCRCSKCTTPGETTAIWVSVDVPSAQPPGQYEGEFVITATKADTETVEPPRVPPKPIDGKPSDELVERVKSATISLRRVLLSPSFADFFSDNGPVDMMDEDAISNLSIRIKLSLMVWDFVLPATPSLSAVIESLLKGIINASKEFFNLTEEEKKEFAGRKILDPIKCGTSLSTSNGMISLGVDFLKLIVQPDQFHSPNKRYKPIGFSEVAVEYCNSGRRILRELLKGISESLGLDNYYVEKTVNLDSSAQLFSANLYPPCPQPQPAMGLPPHSDHGLLTFFIVTG
ncbi:unnamed protein product [Ilex paraguariensis]|uniref:Uncharacterized protein n=1 Tax=Ilex paraguariensis TaxID=185542 RepID=A0ABC8V0Y4_9AQUA